MQKYGISAVGLTKPRLPILFHCCWMFMLAALKYRHTSIIATGAIPVSYTHLHISVPANVTLEGVSNYPPNGLAGSILLAVEGAGAEDGPGFITLHTGAVLKGITIYYPEQTPENLSLIHISLYLFRFCFNVFQQTYFTIMLSLFQQCSIIIPYWLFINNLICCLI